MLNILFITLAVVFIVGCLKGAADTQMKSGMPGWKNKWKTINGTPIKTTAVANPEKAHPWYLGFHMPKYFEKFPFSSTFLVWTTDGWHLYNMLSYRLIDGWLSYLGYLLINPEKPFWYFLCAMFCLYLSRSLGFKLTYYNN